MYVSTFIITPVDHSTGVSNRGVPNFKDDFSRNQKFRDRAVWFPVDDMNMKSPKAKNKPYYITSSLRVLEISKIGLSEK